MAKFKVGDKVWFKAPVTGVKVTAKITATLGGEKYGFVDDDGIRGTIEGNAIYPLNSRACNSRNPIVANAMNACGTARNAGDINAELGRDVDRLDERLKDELKKQAESYAYWIEADCGREINYLLRVAKENKDVQPSIVAELQRLRRRVDEAIAASKRLPR